MLTCLFSTPYYCNQTIKKILNRWDKVPFTKTDNKKKAGQVEHLKLEISSKILLLKAANNKIHHISRYKTVLI